MVIPTIILTVNTGSSSVRLAAFSSDGTKTAELASERLDSGNGGDPAAHLQGFIRKHGLSHIRVVAHRIVHGGLRLTESCLLDQRTENEIEGLARLAPLHNPVALCWIRASRGVVGADVSQVAVFDTAFFATLPQIARVYAIPSELSEKHGLYRYGFHGLAHQAMWRGWCERNPGSRRSGKLISLQLGAGCSITAMEDGSPRDTSMGFSPLEGLMMATRSGDIDAGLVLFLQQEEKMPADGLNRLLNEHSGLLGFSGISSDMRRLLESESERAGFAVDLFCYRVRKYLGAYLAVLEGADAIVFGGGVGENMPAVREKILRGMEWCGIEIDMEKNRDSSGAACISRETSKVEVWVIPVNEAIALANEAMKVISEGKQTKEDIHA